MKKCKNCGKEIEWGKFTPANEKKTGLCVACLNKPFRITSVCRLDLLEDFTPEQIAKLDDADMTHIASKMADAYCDNGFWNDLPIIVENELEDK